MLINEELKPKGKVELFVTKGTPLVDKITGEIDFSSVELIDQETYFNILLAEGKNKLVKALTTGFCKQIARMAIGDRGTIPSDQTVPKVPEQKMTKLYNEIFRSDLDTFVEVTTVDKHEVKFIKSFSALTVPITAFSNQANPIVNEVALVLCDLIGGQPLPREDVAFPNSPISDEELFSIRCFKSVPFEAANEIAITFRYTVYFE